MKSQQIDIFNLILENKTALSNRDGQKPLFSLAEKIAIKDDSVLEINAEQQILNISLNSIEIEQLNTLLSFIHYSKINTEKILLYFDEYIRTNVSNKQNETVVKRGLLCRFIVEQNIKFFKIKNILNEKYLREKSPWIWIDCISYYNWSIAEDEIAKLLSDNEDEIKSLLFRIPALYKRLNSEVFNKSLTKWYANLNKSGREKLDKWADRFNVKIGDISLKAIYKIDSIPFFQNELI